MSDEQYASYEVPGQQLRYRVAQLNAAGIPFNVAGQSGGVYIIVIPMGYVDGMTSLPQPHRRRKPWWMPSRKMLVTLAMVAVVGAGVYMLLSGGIKINGVAMPAMPTLPAVQLPTIELPKAPTVELPKVEMPTLANPFAGVTKSMDEATASINRTAEAAKSAAITFAVIVGSLFAIGGLWALRGPLSAVGHGIGGIAGMIGKAVKRG